MHLLRQVSGELLSEPHFCSGVPSVLLGISFAERGATWAWLRAEPAATERIRPRALLHRLQAVQLV